MGAEFHQTKYLEVRCTDALAQALYEEDGDATLLGNCVAISR